MKEYIKEERLAEVEKAVNSIIEIIKTNSFSFTESEVLTMCDLLAIKLSFLIKSS